MTAYDNRVRARPTGRWGLSTPPKVRVTDSGNPRGPGLGHDGRHHLSAKRIGALLAAAVLTLVASGLLGAKGREAPPPAALVALVSASAPDDDVSATQFCSGVLVSGTTVLTARHCVADRSSSAIQAIVGADNLCSLAPIGGERIGVARIELPSAEQGDLAVIHLERQTHNVPVMHPGPAPAEGTEVIAWGWGRDSFGGTAPCTAQPKDLRVVPASACTPVLQESDPVAPGAYLCATPAAGVNTCEGDSGGPLITADHKILVGLTAGGSCGPRDPGSYVLVPDAVSP